MSTRKVKSKSTRKAISKIAPGRKKKKRERVTVRELIELLAKQCDWDSEVTCISNYYSEVQDRVFNPKELRRKIVAVSHNAEHGTQILFEDKRN